MPLLAPNKARRVVRLGNGRRITVASEAEASEARADDGGTAAGAVTLEASTWRADLPFMSDDLGGWTGGSVWESSEVLARVLTTEPWGDRVKAGARVVELGCGTGLAGVAAAAGGAEAVTLTDRVLFVAEYNLLANFPDERERHQVRRLSWGDEAQLEALQAERGPFDIIITAVRHTGSSPGWHPTARLTRGAAGHAVPRRPHRQLCARPCLSGALHFHHAAREFGPL